MNPVIAHFPERVYRISRAEWRRMIAAGVFENRRAELIRGVIVEMSPQSFPHATCVMRLDRILQRGVGDRAWVRTQLPLIAIDESEPEPDLAVVPDEPEATDHPDRAYLVVEVAVSSVDYDRSTKGELYAESGVPEYWLIDLGRERIEVYDRPSGRHYERRRVFGRGESVAVGAFPDVVVAVDDVLPGAPARG